ncbi:hypothetical protein BPAE_0205g00120 [Botrytis paeoniae]|uniref:Uncharacterized protein n=1 Tax=Botrytis paeoniae TaxID=278948 RepID=A0A4Z1FB68_9HELO|nr:hypothetical protein BPAE_0205g00120 [Botrytis paeoniae]
MSKLQEMNITIKEMYAGDGEFSYIITAICHGSSRRKLLTSQGQGRQEQSTLPEFVGEPFLYAT